jgi:hypothetical protein
MWIIGNRRGNLSSFDCFRHIPIFFMCFACFLLYQCIPIHICVLLLEQLLLPMPISSTTTYKCFVLTALLSLRHPTCKNKNHKYSQKCQPRQRDFPNEGKIILYELNGHSSSFSCICKSGRWGMKSLPTKEAGRAQCCRWNEGRFDVADSRSSYSCMSERWSR